MRVGFYPFKVIICFPCGCQVHISSFHGVMNSQTLGRGNDRIGPKRTGGTSEKKDSRTRNEEMWRPE